MYFENKVRLTILSEIEYFVIMSELIDTSVINQRQNAPGYSIIFQYLEQAIRTGTLPPGCVITEDPIARLFGTSRTPVRKAILELHNANLVERFEGRGYIVGGGVEPIRKAITSEMLGVKPTMGLAKTKISADRISAEFETSLESALPFGVYRVREQSAADYFGVSRTVIRELLSRFQDRGLVHKNIKSHWVIGPLTARDIEHYFAIRCSLEPLALRESAPHISSKELDGYLQHAQDKADKPCDLTSDEIASLEDDLHVRILSHTPNWHLTRMINQCQVALSINKVFSEIIGTRPFSLSLTEHCIILEFMKRNSINAAADALLEHLKLSADRTRERLMAFSVFPAPKLPPYLYPM